METIINQLSNPFLWGFFLFVLGVVVKKKRDAYLRLLRLLIEAIEVVDKDIQNIYPEDYAKKLVRIKDWINKKVGKDKDALDVEIRKKSTAKKN